jgi:hypothetical protein
MRTSQTALHTHREREKERKKDDSYMACTAISPEYLFSLHFSIPFLQNVRKQDESVDISSISSFLHPVGIPTKHDDEKVNIHV